MWSQLVCYFNMDKSLKLDKSIYPFVPCHNFCENNCTADVYFTNKVRERFKEIGIEKDKGNTFLSLLSYISNIYLNTKIFILHFFFKLEKKPHKLSKI